MNLFSVNASAAGLPSARWPHIKLASLHRLLVSCCRIGAGFFTKWLRQTKPTRRTNGRESQRPYKPFSGKERYSVLSNLVSRIYSHPCNAVLASDAPQQGCLGGGSWRLWVQGCRDGLREPSGSTQPRGQCLSLPLTNPHQSLYKWQKWSFTHTDTYRLISMKTSKISFL